MKGMHLVDLDTGVWISNVDERFIVYVHEASIEAGSYSIKWEWLAHPQIAANLQIGSIHSSVGVSTWPYHRPAMRINEEETP